MLRIIYNNIEAERARLGKTIAQMSEMLGVSSKTYGNWVRGITQIPLDSLVTMADLFGCSMDYLAGRQRHS